MQSSRTFTLPWSSPTTVVTKARTVSAVRNLLVVCTANEARSPLVQRLLQAELERRSTEPVHVRSAGTRVVQPGNPMAEVAKAVLRAQGIAERPFSSTSLTLADVVAADLVIVAEAAHVRTVLDLDPTAMRRTYVLLQLASIADAYLNGGGREAPFLTAAPALRRRTRTPSNTGFDLADPTESSRVGVDALQQPVAWAVPLIANALTV